MAKTIRALWGMARPLIMLSVVGVYIFGGLIAQAGGAPFDLGAFAWGLVAVVLVSLSIHYANEYADHETDALAHPTPFSGGSGVLPSGVVPRAVAIQAAWVTLLLGLGVTLAGIAAGALTPAVLAVIVLGAFGGWMYSLPPLALAWHGWGEALNAFLGGSLLPLYGYAVQTGCIDLDVLVICAPFALLAFTNLLATTWADRHADAQVGKYTLATRLPIPQLRLIYGLATVLSFALWPLLSEALVPGEVAVAGLLILPLAIWGGMRYTYTDAPHASVYTMSAMLVVQMAVWFFVGEALG